VANPLCYCIFPFILRIEPAFHLPFLSLLFFYFLLFFFFFFFQPDETLHCGTGRGVTSYSLKPSDSDGVGFSAAQEFVALPWSRRIDPGFVFLVFPSATSFFYLHLFYSTSIRTYVAAVGWDNALTSKIVS
jgi:hypothetical protein